MKRLNSIKRGRTQYNQEVVAFKWTKRNKQKTKEGDGEGGGRGDDGCSGVELSVLPEHSEKRKFN